MSAEAGASFPFSVRGEEQTYFEGCLDGRLLIQRCGQCDRHVFYPRAVCPSCFSRDLTWVEARGRGIVHTFTVQHRPPEGYEHDAPYVLAVIELEEGVRMMSHVHAPPGEVHIDMAVEARWVSHGGTQVPVFVPAGGTGS